MGLTMSTELSPKTSIVDRTRRAFPVSRFIKSFIHLVGDKFAYWVVITFKISTVLGTMGVNDSMNRFTALGLKRI